MSLIHHHQRDSLYKGCDHANRFARATWQACNQSGLSNSCQPGSIGTCT